jgi:hypothetical protein
MSSKEDGFLMLRGLIAMFVVVVCFAAVMAGIAAFSRRGALLLERTEREILNRNEESIKQLK